MSWVQDEPVTSRGPTPDAFGPRWADFSGPGIRPGFYGHGEPEDSGKRPVRRRRGHAGVRLPCHDPPPGGPGHRAAIPPSARHPASERVEWRPATPGHARLAEERISPTGEWHIPSPRLRPAGNRVRLDGRRRQRPAAGALVTAVQASGSAGHGSPDQRRGREDAGCARIEDEDDNVADTAVRPGDPRRPAEWRWLPANPSRTRLLGRSSTRWQSSRWTGVTGNPGRDARPPDCPRPSTAATSNRGRRRLRCTTARG